jgi:hypothetical protein
MISSQGVSDQRERNPWYDTQNTFHPSRICHATTGLLGASGRGGLLQGNSLII